MESLVVRQRLNIGTPILEELQGALLNIKRLNQSWLTRHGWDARHSDDNNFVDEDVENFVSFCQASAISELIAADPVEIFCSSGVLDARVFPPSQAGLSQVLYGLPYPMNVTHEDAGWLLDAAIGVNLIFSMQGPMEFLILRDGGGVVTIAGTPRFIKHMTSNTPFEWIPGLPP